MSRPPLPSSTRIRLRPLTRADVDTHLAAEDEATVRWSSGGVSTRQNVREFVDRSAAAWRDGGTVFDLAIEDGDGTLVGVVGLQHRMDYLTDFQVNVTYTVYPVHRRRGLATEAARLAGDLAAQLWDVDELVIRCAPDNPASAGVARSLGYVLRHRTDDEHGLLDWYARPPAACVRVES